MLNLVSLASSPSCFLLLLLPPLAFGLRPFGYWLLPFGLVQVEWTGIWRLDFGIAWILPPPASPPASLVLHHASCTISLLPYRSSYPTFRHSSLTCLSHPFPLSSPLYEPNHSPRIALLSITLSRSARSSANYIVILKENHWMLYWLVTAMYPQFLITLDENDEEQDVTVRVGQAVNTVGLAGTRSGISGVGVYSSSSFFSSSSLLRLLPLTFDHTQCPPSPRSLYLRRS